MPKSTAIVSPNLGLHLDKPAIALPIGALKDGNNFRVKEGSLTNLNMGWERFSDFVLDGPVRMIDTFALRSGVAHLIFATEKSLYRYSEGDDAVYYITPVYNTGTAAASGTAVTGTGTNWDPEARPGDLIFFGANDEDDPAATWYEIDEVTNDTTITLTTDAGTVVDGPYTILKRFQMDGGDTWSYDTFVNNAGTEDRWYATNGVDDPIRWNGTGAAVYLTSLGITAVKSLTVYSNMMIYANFSQGGSIKPADILNSDVGDAEDVSTGLSEQFTVHGETDGIVAAYPLGDNLVLYSPRTIVLAQFVGDPLVFTFRVGSTGVGPISGNAIADFGDYHNFLGFDSQYRFDGVTLSEDNPHVWREVIRRNDPTRRNIAYVHFDENNGDLIWSLGLTTDTDAGVQGGSPERAFAQHYLENVDPRLPMPHSQRDWPFTAAGSYSRQTGLTWDEIADTWDTLNFRWNDQFFFAAFPLILVGDHDGKVYTANVQQNKDDGTGLTSYVHFGRFPTFDGRTRGLIRRVYPWVQQFDCDLDISVYLSDHAAGPSTVEGPNAYDQSLPEGGHFQSIFRRARFFEVRFGSEGPDEPWILEGWDYDVSPGGRR